MTARPTTVSFEKGLRQDDLGRNFNGFGRGPQLRGGFSTATSWNSWGMKPPVGLENSNTASTTFLSSGLGSSTFLSRPTRENSSSSWWEEQTAYVASGTAASSSTATCFGGVLSASSSVRASGGSKQRPTSVAATSGFSDTRGYSDFDALLRGEFSQSAASAETLPIKQKQPVEWDRNTGHRVFPSAVDENGRNPLRTTTAPAGDSMRDAAATKAAADQRRPSKATSAQPKKQARSFSDLKFTMAAVITHRLRFLRKTATHRLIEMSLKAGATTGSAFRRQASEVLQIVSDLNKQLDAQLQREEDDVDDFGVEVPDFLRGRLMEGHPLLVQMMALKESKSALRKQFHKLNKKHDEHTIEMKRIEKKLRLLARRTNFLTSTATGGLSEDKLQRMFDRWMVYQTTAAKGALGLWQIGNFRNFTEYGLTFKTAREELMGERPDSRSKQDAAEEDTTNVKELRSLKARQRELIRWGQEQVVADNQKTRLCKLYLQHKCFKGEQCEFAHSLTEVHAARAACQKARLLAEEAAASGQNWQPSNMEATKQKSTGPFAKIDTETQEKFQRLAGFITNGQTSIESMSKRVETDGAYFESVFSNIISELESDVKMDVERMAKNVNLIPKDFISRLECLSVDEGGSEEVRLQRMLRQLTSIRDGLLTEVEQAGLDRRTKVPQSELSQEKDRDPVIQTNSKVIPVKLELGDEKGVGFEVQLNDTGVPCVSVVDARGLMQEWNLDHPELAVKAGDQIASEDPALLAWIVRRRVWAGRAFGNIEAPRGVLKLYAVRPPGGSKSSAGETEDRKGSHSSYSTASSKAGSAADEQVSPSTALNSRLRPIGSKPTKPHTEALQAASRVNKDKDGAEGERDSFHYSDEGQLDISMTLSRSFTNFYMAKVELRYVAQELAREFAVVGEDTDILLKDAEELHGKATQALSVTRDPGAPQALPNLPDPAEITSNIKLPKVAPPPPPIQVPMTMELKPLTPPTPVVEEVEEEPQPAEQPVRSPAPSPAHAALEQEEELSPQELEAVTLDVSHYESANAKLKQMIDGLKRRLTELQSASAESVLAFQMAMKMGASTTAGAEMARKAMELEARKDQATTALKTAVKKSRKARAEERLSPTSQRLGDSSASSEDDEDEDEYSHSHSDGDRQSFAEKTGSRGQVSFHMSKPSSLDSPKSGPEASRAARSQPEAKAEATDDKPQEVGLSVDNLLAKMQDEVASSAGTRPISEEATQAKEVQEQMKARRSVKLDAQRRMSQSQEKGWFPEAGVPRGGLLAAPNTQPADPPAETPAPARTSDVPQVREERRSSAAREPSPAVTRSFSPQSKERSQSPAGRKQSTNFVVQQDPAELVKAIPRKEGIFTWKDALKAMKDKKEVKNEILERPKQKFEGYRVTLVQKALISRSRLKRRQRILKSIMRSKEQGKDDLIPTEEEEFQKLNTQLSKLTKLKDYWANKMEKRLSPPKPRTPKAETPTLGMDSSRASTAEGDLASTMQPVQESFKRPSWANNVFEPGGAMMGKGLGIGSAPPPLVAKSQPAVQPTSQETAAIRNLLGKSASSPISGGEPRTFEEDPTAETGLPSLWGKVRRRMTALQGLSGLANGRLSSDASGLIRGQGLLVRSFAVRESDQDAVQGLTSEISSLEPKSPRSPGAPTLDGVVHVQSLLAGSKMCAAGADSPLAAEKMGMASTRSETVRRYNSVENPSSTARSSTEEIPPTIRRTSASGSVTSLIKADAAKDEPLDLAVGSTVSYQSTASVSVRVGNPKDKDKENDNGKPVDKDKVPPLVSKAAHKDKDKGALFIGKPVAKSDSTEQDNEKSLTKSVGAAVVGGIRMQRDAAAAATKSAVAAAREERAARRKDELHRRPSSGLGMATLDTGTSSRRRKTAEEEEEAEPPARNPNFWWQVDSSLENLQTATQRRNAQGNPASPTSPKTTADPTSPASAVPSATLPVDAVQSGEDPPMQRQLTPLTSAEAAEAPLSDEDERPPSAKRRREPAFPPTSREPVFSLDDSEDNRPPNSMMSLVRQSDSAGPQPKENQHQQLQPHLQPQLHLQSQQPQLAQGQHEEASATVENPQEHLEQRERPEQPGQPVQPGQQGQPGQHEQSDRREKPQQKPQSVEQPQPHQQPRGRPEQRSKEAPSKKLGLVGWRQLPDQQEQQQQPAQQPPPARSQGVSLDFMLQGQKPNASELASSGLAARSPRPNAAIASVKGGRSPVRGNLARGASPLVLLPSGSSSNLGLDNLAAKSMPMSRSKSDFAGHPALQRSPPEAVASFEVVGRTANNAPSLTGSVSLDALVSNRPPPRIASTWTARGPAQQRGAIDPSQMLQQLPDLSRSAVDDAFGSRSSPVSSPRQRSQPSMTRAAAEQQPSSEGVRVSQTSLLNSLLSPDAGPEPSPGPAAAPSPAGFKPLGSMPQVQAKAPSSGEAAARQTVIPVSPGSFELHNGHEPRPQGSLHGSPREPCSLREPLSPCTPKQRLSLGSLPSSPHQPQRLSFGNPSLEVGSPEGSAREPRSPHDSRSPRKPQPRVSFGSYEDGRWDRAVSLDELASDDGLEGRGRRPSQLRPLGMLASRGVRQRVGPSLMEMASMVESASEPWLPALLTSHLDRRRSVSLRRRPSPDGAVDLDLLPGSGPRGWSLPPLSSRLPEELSVRLMPLQPRSQATSRSRSRSPGGFVRAISDGPRGVPSTHAEMAVAELASQLGGKVLRGQQDEGAVSLDVAAAFMGLRRSRSPEGGHPEQREVFKTTSRAQPMRPLLWRGNSVFTGLDDFPEASFPSSTGGPRSPKRRLGQHLPRLKTHLPSRLVQLPALGETSPGFSARREPGGFVKQRMQNMQSLTPRTDAVDHRRHQLPSLWSGAATARLPASREAAHERKACATGSPPLRPAGAVQTHAQSWTATAMQAPSAKVLRARTQGNGWQSAREPRVRPQQLDPLPSARASGIDEEATGSDPLHMKLSRYMSNFDVGDLDAILASEPTTPTSSAAPATLAGLAATGAFEAASAKPRGQKPTSSTGQRSPHKLPSSQMLLPDLPMQVGPDSAFSSKAAKATLPVKRGGSKSASLRDTQRQPSRQISGRSKGHKRSNTKEEWIQRLGGGASDVLPFDRVGSGSSEDAVQI